MEKENTEEVALTEDGVPKPIHGKICAAWFTGIVAMVLTVVMIAYSWYSKELTVVGPASFIDIALLGGIVFGVYKRSRVCAVLLLLYHLINSVVLTLLVGGPGNIPMVLLFTVMYILGVIGTFQYHKYKKNLHNNPVNLRLLRSRKLPGRYRPDLMARFKTNRA